MAKSSIDVVIDKADEVNAKLPVLPKNVKDLLITIAPWFALIFGILDVWGGITGLGLFGVLAPFGSILTVSSVLSIVTGALLLLSFTGLKSHKEKGWRFFFYSGVVGLVSSLLMLPASLIGVAISLVVLYLILQIRSHYK